MHTYSMHTAASAHLLQVRQPPRLRRLLRLLRAQLLAHPPQLRPLSLQTPPRQVGSGAVRLGRLLSVGDVGLRRAQALLPGVQLLVGVLCVWDNLSFYFM